MAQPASSTQQYFLGIGGAQTGPHSEAEIVQKIRAGLPTDTLVWFEGLSEWQPVTTVPVFDAAYKNVTPAGSLPSPDKDAPLEPSAPIVPRVHFKPLTEEGGEVTPTLVSGSSAASNLRASTFDNSPAEPIFGPEEATFTQASFVTDRIYFIIGGVTLILGGVVIYFLVSAGSAGRDAASRTPKGPPPNKTGLTALTPREAELRKATSELALQPGPSLESLNKLINENSDDAFGKQAITAAVDYYRVHSPSEGGRLLMKIKRPEDAIGFFLTEPANLQEAEKAYFASFEASTDDTKRKDYLLKDIQLLLGLLKDPGKAQTRVELLEKTFPGQQHTYGYYLKSTEEKIKDLFGRISFYFVQTLMAYLDSELPQIALAKRPLVELKKDRMGKYRIVGTYKGDVLLNQDRLGNIYFTFWLTDKQWELVDTNLTAERRIASHRERDREKKGAVTAPEMLATLERVFKTQFPKNGVHERVSLPPAQKPSAQ
jgi:GYF domain 2